MAKRATISEAHLDPGRNSRIGKRMQKVLTTSSECARVVCIAGATPAESERKVKIMTVTKKVSRKVSGVAKVANVSFEVPSPDPTEAVGFFGGDFSRLVKWACYGLWKKIQSDASNTLGQGDVAARNLEKAVKSVASVTKQDESVVRAMLLASNEDLRKALETPATAPGAVQEITIKTSEYLDAPDILGIEPEDEESETASA